MLPARPLQWVVGIVGFGFVLYLVVLIADLIYDVLIGRYDHGDRDVHIMVIAVSAVQAWVTVWGTRKLWRWLARP